jgi:hypothetical protein
MLPKQSPSLVNFSHEPPLNSPKIIAANPHQPQQPLFQLPTTIPNINHTILATQNHHTTALSLNKTNLPKKINL